MILCRRFSTCRHFSLSISLKLDQVSLINVSSWCCPPLFCLLQVSWPLTFWASRWWERTSVASARSRRRNSVSAGRSWELFIPSLATTTPSTWGWDLNVAAPVSPMSRNSLHCSTNWSYTIFTLFKFAASGPDSFQPSGSYSHETGSAAALLSLPSPLHSLPSRTRTRTHCRAADHVWVSNPACFYLDLICFFFWLHWKDLWHMYPVCRFPKDIKTYGIDKQFLWGKSLLVTPVLDPGMDYVEGYFPEGLWYDYYTVRPTANIQPRTHTDYRDLKFANSLWSHVFICFKGRGRSQ